MTIYLAQLYRFGYNLTAIGKTKDQVARTIMKEYRKTYRELNGSLCMADAQRAAEEIEITELQYGHVEWL